MGCEAFVLAVDCPDGALESARERVLRLERRWSRFIDDSEVSRMNAVAGRPAVVSRDTYELVARAVDGWQATAGRFDPTVLGALMAAGYDRTFTSLQSQRRASAGRATVAPAPGCAGIVLDPVIPSVTLPSGVAFDPGGIGKGLGADFVARQLISHGAAGACVNLGGDVRVTGQAPTEAGWVIGVEHPADREVEIARLALAEGAVVTTSRMMRTWDDGGERRHHVIDPASGSSADPGLMSVTVVAGDAWWAEVLAKAAFVAGLDAGREVLAAAGATGVFVDDAGEVHLVQGIEELLA